MRKVELRMNEKLKYKVIKKLVETNGNKERAAVALGRSVRQIDRMIAGYKAKGKEFFIHGNRNRKPVHALTEAQKTEIEQIYLSKYFDCTYTAFTEYLAQKENITLSVDEVRTILIDKYIFSPRTHKSTKKRIKKQLLKEQEKAKRKSKNTSQDSCDGRCPPKTTKMPIFRRRNTNGCMYSFMVWKGQNGASRSNRRCHRTSSRIIF